MIKKLFGLLGLFCLNTSVFSQQVEMADAFRSEGKIYVVVAILVFVMICLFLYLFRIERKLKKLEKENSKG